MQKTKWNWSEESERDGVGRRPAVLFSPAVQTRDMWLPRQAVQSGRARWTHYRQGQDGIAWRNTIGSFGELEQSKLNCVSLCVCVCVCMCMSVHMPVFVWNGMCGQLSISSLRLCHPWLPPPAPPSGRVHTHTYSHKHTHTHTHILTHTFTLLRPSQKDCLNVFSCTGQLSDEVASHRLSLVGHFI